MEIECDLEDDGELDELEVQRYSDGHCDDDFGDEIELKPHKCAMNPWEPGKFIMLTFDPPPMDPIAAAIVLVIFCCICCCACAAAVAGEGKIKASYSEIEDEDGHDS